MRFCIALLTLLLTCLSPALGQAFKYWDVTEGLSDSHVTTIQKDSYGFIWLLTYSGIDRFDGKNIRNYRLQSDDGYVPFYSEKNSLKTDRTGRIWAMGPEGELFKHIPLVDYFQEVKLPPAMTEVPPYLVRMTDFDEVWYCYDSIGYVYHLEHDSIQCIPFGKQLQYITDIQQTDEQTYFICSSQGVFRAVMEGQQFGITDTLLPAKEFKDPQIVHTCTSSGRMFVGSEEAGLVVYDLTARQIEQSFPELIDFIISDICPYKQGRLLVSTRGAGVFLYDFGTKTLTPFLRADYEKPLGMNGNNVHAMYVDESKRVWMSVFGRGITCYDELLPAYTLYEKQVKDKNTLNDNLVNAVLEDSDGDFWFATNNGLSLYFTAKGTWRHFFAWDKSDPETMKDCIFLSLCETSPGVIAAGGFMTGLYLIDKKTMTSRNVTPSTYRWEDGRQLPNRYIRVIHTDSDGIVWTGGSNYLGRTDRAKGEFRHIPIGRAITCILEKDSATLWIGTGDGIYSINRKTFETRKLRMPFSSQQVNDMYLHTDGDLYIATTNSGLVVLHRNGEHDIYRYQTTALLSNIIHTIVPASDDKLVVATDRNVSLFNIKKKTFRNWTDDQGLITTSFNPRAGIHTSRGTFLFGTNGGAIEWCDSMRLTRRDSTRVIIDKIYVENRQGAHPDAALLNIGSLDSLDVLHLEHDQNSLTIHISAIDYENPQYTYFRWRLTGRYDYWTNMEGNSWLQYRDLKPGEYTLKIQNIAREDYRVLGEKTVKIVILPSFWETSWGTLLTLLALSLMGWLVWHYVSMKITQYKMQRLNRTLISAIGNARTPLALMKAASVEVLRKSSLPTKEHNFLRLTAHCADTLNLWANNLWRLQSVKRLAKPLVEERDVNALFREYTEFFVPLFTEKQLCVNFPNAESPLTVWIDVTKIELIFCNLFACLIRHTSDEGEISLTTTMTGRHWTLTMQNDSYTSSLLEQPDGQPASGSRLPRTDKKQLKAELYAIYRVVRSHRGTLKLNGCPPSGFRFEVSFPLNSSAYNKLKGEKGGITSILSGLSFWKEFPLLQLRPAKKIDPSKRKGHILLADQSPEVLAFLCNSLNDEWDVLTARSERTALGFVHEFQPDIIISSFKILDEMGEDFCSVLKSDVNTSHIPIILIASDDDRQSITEGFRLRADYYVTSPYDLVVLRAILSNIVENRRSLQSRLSQVDVVHHLKEISNAHVEQDTKFLDEMKQMVREHVNDRSFNVDDLCVLMGMSRTSLYSKVKTLTESSPSEIIREIRMQHACDLLLSREYSIMQVCDRMGFSEPKYFREVFKKYSGLTPGEYIKKQSNLDKS